MSIIDDIERVIYGNPTEEDMWEWVSTTINYEDKNGHPLTVALNKVDTHEYEFKVWDTYSDEAKVVAHDSYYFGPNLSTHKQIADCVVYMVDANDEGE